MKCRKCGSEVRPNSQFCHTCGAPIELVNPDKGGNFVRVAFVFIGIFPALIAAFEFVLAVMSKKFSLPLVFDLLVAVSALTFFAFIYRGHQWAILPIGLILIISSLVKIIFLFMAYKLSVYFLFGASFSILYIAFGSYLIRSKDVLAFIKNRAKEAA